MDEDCVVRGMYSFRRGDLVAVASREACSKVQPIDETSSDFDTSWYFDKTGIVNNVSASGDIAVTFEGGTLGTIEPEALIKMPHLRIGDLVKIVDDIRGDGNLQLNEIPGYKSEAEAIGEIGGVLHYWNEEHIGVCLKLKEGCLYLGYLHVEFVARPICGYIKGYVYRPIMPPNPKKQLLNALQDCMKDLCDVDPLAKRPVHDVNMKILPMPLN